MNANLKKGIPFLSFLFLLFPLIFNFLLPLLLLLLS
jgi:hypothetical protein